MILRKPISVLLITAFRLLRKTVIGKTCPADFRFLLIYVRKTVIGKTYPADFRFLLICVRKTVIGKTYPADFRFLLICVRKTVIGKTCPADFRFSCRFLLLAHLRTQNGNKQDLSCGFSLFLTISASCSFSNAIYFNIIILLK